MDERLKRGPCTFVRDRFRDCRHYWQTKRCDLDNEYCRHPTSHVLRLKCTKVSEFALKTEGESLTNLNGPPIEELRKRVKIVPRTTIIEGAGEGEP